MPNFFFFLKISPFVGISPTMHREMENMCVYVCILLIYDLTYAHLIKHNFTSEMESSFPLLNSNNRDMDNLIQCYVVCFFKMNFKIIYFLKALIGAAQNQHICT